MKLDFTFMYIQISFSYHILENKIKHDNNMNSRTINCHNPRDVTSLPGHNGSGTRNNTATFVRSNGPHVWHLHNLTLSRTQSRIPTVSALWMWICFNSVLFVVGWISFGLWFNFNEWSFCYFAVEIFLLYIHTPRVGPKRMN